MDQSFDLPHPDFLKEIHKNSLNIRGFLEYVKEQLNNGRFTLNDTNTLPMGFSKQYKYIVKTEIPDGALKGNIGLYIDALGKNSVYKNIRIERTGAGRPDFIYELSFEMD
jgi:hypothetical protein